MGSVMDYLIWLVLIAIAVNDAKEHRIPNRYLLVVLMLCLIEGVIHSNPIATLSTACLGGLALFGSSLLLHFARVMSPGDVKLLGVVGFWLGWGNLLSASAWIGVASVVVGLFYAALNQMDTRTRWQDLLTKYTLVFAYGRQANAMVAGEQAFEQKLRMPFAPAVVIGLALFRYF